MYLGHGLPLSSYRACMSFHFKCNALYVPLQPRSGPHAAFHYRLELRVENWSRWVKPEARHTGCLLCSQRPALPSLVHGKDLEVIGDPGWQSSDFSEGVPADRQPLSVLPWQADGEYIHSVAWHRTVRGCPHDGDLHVRHFHKLQVSGRGNFI